MIIILEKPVLSPNNGIIGNKMAVENMMHFQKLAKCGPVYRLGQVENKN